MKMTALSNLLVAYYLFKSLRLALSNESQRILTTNLRTLLRPNLVRDQTPEYFVDLSPRRNRPLQYHQAGLVVSHSL